MSFVADNDLFREYRLFRFDERENALEMFIDEVKKVFHCIEGLLFLNGKGKGVSVGPVFYHSLSSSFIRFSVRVSASMTVT